MLDMAKKKPQSDRHKPGTFAVRLPASARGVLEALARKNRRTMVAELLLALEARARAEGVPLGQLGAEGDDQG